MVCFIRNAYYCGLMSACEHCNNWKMCLHSAADPASKVTGVILVIFGIQVSLRVYYL